MPLYKKPETLVVGDGLCQIHNSKKIRASLRLIQKQNENIEQELGRGQGGMFIFGH
jgi:hypothetical protein